MQREGAGNYCCLLEVEGWREERWWGKKVKGRGGIARHL